MYLFPDSQHSSAFLACHNNLMIYLFVCLFVCVRVATVNTTVSTTPLPTTAEWITDFTDIVSKFSLRTADIPDDDMCYIFAGRPETIEECKFNASTQSFVVIHGWTVCHPADTTMDRYFT